MLTTIPLITALLFPGRFILATPPPSISRRSPYETNPGPDLNTTVVCIDSLYTCGPLTPTAATVQSFNASPMPTSSQPSATPPPLTPAHSLLASRIALKGMAMRDHDFEKEHDEKSTTTKKSTSPSPVSGAKNTVDPSTVYGKQGLSKCQYDIILKITSVFETSNKNLGFNLCGNWNDGQGISAGFIQFTTSSGSALRVVQSYLQLTRRPNPPLASFVTALQRAAQVGNKGAVSGQGFMTGLSGFCDAWEEANKNDGAAFQNAQLAIQSAGYLQPNLKIVQQLGLKTALSVGQLMDTAIQLGYDAVEEIAGNAGWTPSQGANEADYLKRYLDARIVYLNNLGGAYPGTKYRVNSYKYMLQKGNVNFVGGSVVMLENGGNPVQITC
ncbi:lysozyme-like domain-containing protein [Chytridium lagenaria]|nr:lysozyme-like domain-containing protein [Chytridium lagenaria]